MPHRAATAPASRERAESDLAELPQTDSSRRGSGEGSVSLNLEASSSTDPAKRTDDVLWYDPHLPRIVI